MDHFQLIKLVRLIKLIIYFNCFKYLKYVIKILKLLSHDLILTLIIIKLEHLNTIFYPNISI